MNTTANLSWDEHIEPHFRYFLPSMLDILAPSESQKRKIEAKYNDRLRCETVAIRRSGIFEAETTVFDLLWHAREGDQTSLAFANFIETTCKSLVKRLGRSHISKLRKTCYQAILNFDDTTSRYLCYVGELASLERILSDESNWLDDVEHRLPNGKTFDFSIIRPDSSRLLIEVSNLFLNKERLGTEDEFAQFLEARYVKKLHDKTDGIEPRKYAFALLPVIWADGRTLQQYMSYFQTFAPPNDVVLAPMIITAMRNTQTGEVIFIYVDIKQHLEAMRKRKTT